MASRTLTAPPTRRRRLDAADVLLVALAALICFAAAYPFFFVLSLSVMAWVGVFSVSERIAHGAVRAWKAVAPRVSRA